MCRYNHLHNLRFQIIIYFCLCYCLQAHMGSAFKNRIYLKSDRWKTPVFGEIRVSCVPLSAWSCRKARLPRNGIIAEHKMESVVHAYHALMFDSWVTVIFVLPLCEKGQIMDSYASPLICIWILEISEIFHTDVINKLHEFFREMTRYNTANA